MCIRDRGNTLSANNEEVKEIQNGLAAGNSTLFSLMAVIKSRNVQRKTKLQLCKTLVRKVVSYWSEGRSLTEKSYNSWTCLRGRWWVGDIRICERKRNLECSVRSRVLRIKQGTQILRLHKVEDSVTGRVCTANAARQTPKKVYTGQPGGNDQWENWEWGARIV